MGINGHIYLLQASIATLGMQRSTSFNINKTDEDNSTVLVLALRQKRLEFVKYLLRLPQISTTIYSHKYGLPLHVALHQSEFNLALKLLKRQDQLKTPEESVELDVNVPNEQGNTAMHLLFINFSQDPELAAQVAKILIKKGANLRAKNKNELGLLHAAVNNGTIKALEFARDHNRMLRAKRNKTSDLADA
jgi:ankyrin repeat protein